MVWSGLSGLDTVRSASFVEPSDSISSAGSNSRDLVSCETETRMNGAR